MRSRRHTNQSLDTPGHDSIRQYNPTAPKRSHRWRTFFVTLLALIFLGGIVRAFLPWAIRDYVNDVLDRGPLYTGTIGKIEIHLWRGAYSIDDVRISKTTGASAAPFFSAKRVDFAIQWNALFHGRLVGRMEMEQPEINFVDAPGEDSTQTGAGGAWLKTIEDLFPFQINRAVIKDGAVHFRVFQTKKPVDVYLSQVQLSVDNLGNIRDETTPLVSTVHATAMVMDQAKLEFNMTLDPFSYRPTFHLATRLIGLDVTKINDLALEYGKFDFQHGWFDFVLEVDSKEGLFTGYAKPLFRNLEVFSPVEDFKENPLTFLWQAMIGATTSLLKNPPRDQFGTLIPFSGNLSGTTTDIFAALGNVLRNAFIRAYLPGLETGGSGSTEIQFQPAEFIESLAVGDAP